MGARSRTDSPGSIMLGTPKIFQESLLFVLVYYLHGQTFQPCGLRMFRYHQRIFMNSSIVANAVPKVASVIPSKNAHMRKAELGKQLRHFFLGIILYKYKKISAQRFLPLTAIVPE